MPYDYIGSKEVAFIVVDAQEYPPLPPNWEEFLRTKVFFDQVIGGDLRNISELFHTEEPDLMAMYTDRTELRCLEILIIISCMDQL